MNMEMLILAIIMAFVMGVLAHMEYTRSLVSIKRKAMLWTADEIAGIRTEVWASFEQSKDLPGFTVPAKYWRELLDEYIKYCIKLDDSTEDDIISALNRFRSHFNTQVLCQMYHILVMDALKVKLHEKYKDDWEKKA